jgi:hypothetical protein
MGGRVFDGCAALKTVSILGAVSKLEMGLFWDCTSLETVTLGVGIKKIEADVFDGCTSLKTINVPAKKADYYKKRLPEKLHGIIVELPAEKAKK